jgi:unsaturated rhamnogalacturonyl hydrolase
MIGQKSVSHKIGCASFKSGLFILFLICVPFMNCTSNGTSKSQLWSVRMAESVMTRRPNGYGDWDYVTGTVLKGFEELWRKTSDKRYFQYIQKTVDSVVNSDGSINDYKLSDYNIDEINEGRMLLFLYKETAE